MSQTQTILRSRVTDSDRNHGATINMENSGKQQTWSTNLEME